MTAADITTTAAIVAAWEDTVPYFPATAPAGTCTRLFGVGSPACRQAKSESAGMSSPSRAGENIGRQRGGKSAQRCFRGPECLKMPQSMSESTRARASAARKSSVLRHP